jgi:hypothetical protein
LWLSLLIAPVGFVLVWMRGDWGIFRRLAMSLLMIAILCGELFALGLRVVWNGGFSGIAEVRFESRAQHDRRLEANRAQQVTVAAEPVRTPDPEPVTATAPAAAARRSILLDGFSRTRSRRSLF